jgi:hypothetical protein
VHVPKRSPGIAPLGTVTMRENTRPVASGLSGADEPSPAQLRLQLTARKVLAGFVPGITVAVNVTSVPGVGFCGVVAMLTVGGVVSSAAAVEPTTKTATSAHATSAPARKRELLN